MGYYSNFEGSFTLREPLNETQLNELHAVVAMSGYDDIFEISALSIDIESDDCKWYYARDTMAKVFAVIKDNGPEGSMQVQGEDSTDIWRLRVADGELVEEVATISWPNGEKFVSNYR